MNANVVQDELTVVACSACFQDRGLILDAMQIGRKESSSCPNCGRNDGIKLGRAPLAYLAERFFILGSIHRTAFGAAPVVQFNEHQSTSISVSPWLTGDLRIFETILGVGFFHYGPRLWMVGDIEPLNALQDSSTRPSIIERVLKEYPERSIETTESFYRVRKSPEQPDNPREYDTPPAELAGDGRLNTSGFPVFYASPDLEVCVHESRFVAEDDLYVATVKPARPLRLLDLTALLDEDVTEFESLDLAINMLFLAGKHAYPLAQDIAKSALASGFDGLIYPSYFSVLRTGAIPFETTYGISHRRIPQYKEYEEAKSVPNVALFGSPIRDGLLTVDSINRLVITRVSYDFHFGPVTN